MKERSWDGWRRFEADEQAGDRVLMYIIPPTPAAFTSLAKISPALVPNVRIGIV